MKEILLVILVLMFLDIGYNKKDEDDIMPPKTNSSPSINELRPAYAFDSDGNLYVSGIMYNSIHAMNQKYIFFGASANNPNIAYYYGENINFPTVLKYYTNVKGVAVIEDYDDGYELAKSVMYNKHEVIVPDNSKINLPETNTEYANAWKNSVGGTMIGYWYADRTASFIFDVDKNLTVIYKEHRWNGSRLAETGETIIITFTFWGAMMYDNIIYGIYYYKEGESMYYQTIAFNLSGSKISNRDIQDIQTFIHPGMSVIEIDYKNMKPSQTDTLNSQAWLSNVSGKTIYDGM